MDKTRLHKLAGIKLTESIDPIVKTSISGIKFSNELKFKQFLKEHNLAAEVDSMTGSAVFECKYSEVAGLTDLLKLWSLSEAHLSSDEKDKVEEIVKGMKDKESEFKEKYGDKWKSVMYATATKMAQESVNESVEYEWETQGRYEGKWECVDTNTSLKDARESIASYRDNEKGTEFRLKRLRSKDSSKKMNEESNHRFTFNKEFDRWYWSEDGGLNWTQLPKSVTSKEQAKKYVGLKENEDADDNNIVEESSKLYVLKIAEPDSDFGIQFSGTKKECSDEWRDTKKDWPAGSKHKIEPHDDTIKEEVESVDDTLTPVEPEKDKEDDLKADIPKELKSSITKRISELKSSIKLYDEKGYNDNSQKEKAIECLEKILDNLSTGDMAGVKKAQIFYGTLMNPITELFPYNLIRFLSNIKTKK